MRPGCFLLFLLGHLFLIDRAGDVISYYMKQEWLDGIIVTTLISIQDLMTFNYHTLYDLGIFANAAFFAFLSVRVFDSIKDERRREEEGRRELGQSCKKQKIAISKNLLKGAQMPNKDSSKQSIIQYPQLLFATLAGWHWC